MIASFALLLQFLLQERALRILDLNVDPKRLKIDITAGSDGFWGWLMRALGIGTKSGFSVDETGCRRTAHGFVSTSRTFAPLYNLSAAVYFIVKPLLSLIIGLIASFWTCILFSSVFFQRQGPDTMSLLLIAVFGCVGVACLWRFFKGDRTIVMGVVTNAGALVSIKLKVQIADFPTFHQAIAILETVVARANGGTATLEDFYNAGSTYEDSPDESGPSDQELESSAPPTVQPGQRHVADAKRIIECPHCETKLRLNVSILGSRIRCPSCQEPFVAK